MCFGGIVFAAAVGHGALQQMRDAFFSEVEVVEPAVFMQREGLHAVVDGMRRNAGEIDVPMAAAADVALKHGAKHRFEISGTVGFAIHALMQNDKACACLRECLHLRPAGGFKERMLVAAVHEQQHAACTIEHGFVFWPAFRHHHRRDAGHGLQPVHEQRTTGEVFMLSRLVARRPGDEYDLRSLGIGGHLFQRHLLLLGGELSMEGSGEQEKEDETVHDWQAEGLESATQDEKPQGALARSALPTRLMPHARRARLNRAHPRSATERNHENATASAMKASTSVSVVCHEHISRLPPPMKL